MEEHSQCFVRRLKPAASGSLTKAKKNPTVMPYVRPVQQLGETGNISLPDTESITQSGRKPESEAPQNENESENDTENSSNKSIVESSKHHTQDTSSHVRKKKKIPPQKDEVDVAVLQYIQEKDEQQEQPLRVASSWSFSTRRTVSTPAPLPNDVASSPFSTDTYYSTRK